MHKYKLTNSCSYWSCSAKYWFYGILLLTRLQSKSSWSRQLYW